MSTIKADGVEAATGTNTDLTLAGKGTGVPDLAAGFKVGSVAGVPTASIRDDAVTTAKIVNDAVTLAKLASGTDGELITWDASGDPAAVAVGTATHVLTSNGAGAAPTFQAAGGGGFTLLTPAATTSGTSHDFTIPSGATVIYVSFDSVSTNGSSLVGLLLGDSGGIETSAYVGYVSKVAGNVSQSNASLFPVGYSTAAGDRITGGFTLTLMNNSTNLWVMSGDSVEHFNIGAVYHTAGRKLLSSELTTVRLGTMNGTDIFDLGAVNVSYI